MSYHSRSLDSATTAAYRMVLPTISCEKGSLISPRYYVEGTLAVHDESAVTHDSQPGHMIILSPCSNLASAIISLFVARPMGAVNIRRQRSLSETSDGSSSASPLLPLGLISTDLCLPRGNANALKWQASLFGCYSKDLKETTLSCVACHWIHHSAGF